jgi:hypothetical protein
MKEPSEEEINEFMAELSRIGKDDIKPKMMSSAFVLMPFMGTMETDIYLALQLGLCLLLEKPLIVLALGNAYVPPRILELAYAVVRGATLDDAQDQMMAVMLELRRRQRKAQ